MEDRDLQVSRGERRPRWMARNWKWFVPLFILGIFVFCGGVGVWLFAKYVGQGEFLEIYRADKAIKASEPFRMAMELLAADAEVVDRLGEGIEVSGQASGSISDEGGANGESSGSLNCYFPISGPKGEADVACQGKMIDGKWGLSVLNVTFADGTRHAVEISGGEDGIEEAPAWAP